jgi:hypothetical protein
MSTDKRLSFAADGPGRYRMTCGDLLLATFATYDGFVVINDCRMAHERDYRSTGNLGTAAGRVARWYWQAGEVPSPEYDRLMADLQRHYELGEPWTGGAIGAAA